MPACLAGIAQNLGDAAEAVVGVGGQQHPLLARRHRQGRAVTPYGQWPEKAEIHFHQNAMAIR